MSQSSEPIREIRRSLAVVLGKESGDIKDAIRRLDALRRSAQGHLGHYLQKRSYQKAWLLLDGENPEKGACGR